MSRAAAPHPDAAPRAAVRREGRRTVGSVCGRSEDPRDAALHPTLAALPACGALEPPYRAPLHAAPEPSQPGRSSRPVRAVLSSHWVKWPSITEAGGRACSPSVALATARPERPQPGRGGQLLRGAGERVGDMVSAAGPGCLPQYADFRARILGYP